MKVLRLEYDVKGESGSEYPNLIFEDEVDSSEHLGEGTECEGIHPLTDEPVVYKYWLFKLSEVGCVLESIVKAKSFS